jgi:hypothetical protein
MNWDEEARAKAVAAAAARVSGYYWIKRNEPDGPPEWEIARFVAKPWQWEGHERPGWYVTGSSSRHSEVAHPFSNAWEINETMLAPPDPTS